MCTYNVYNVYIYTCMHVYMPYMFVYTCTRAVTIYTLYIDEGGVCIGHIACLAYRVPTVYLKCRAYAAWTVCMQCTEWTSQGAQCIERRHCIQCMR